MIHTDTGLLAPSPIEGALEYHDAVRSAVVIGLPRPGRTERVHAVLDVPSGSLSLPELVAMMADRFPEVRCPESWEICTRPLRDNAGKARRSALRADRLAHPITRPAIDMP
jgi:bile acid-coenzyme A ligase